LLFVPLLQEGGLAANCARYLLPSC